jgi:hypothetical protein
MRSGLDLVKGSGLDLYSVELGGCVKRDSTPSWMRRELLFVDCAYLATAVVPAIRADQVRRLQLAALRTRAEGQRSKSVVRATLGGACLGVTAFGIRHESVSTMIKNRSEPGEAGILPPDIATTRGRIEVRPAVRAETAAVFTA